MADLYLNQKKKIEQPTVVQLAGGRRVQVLNPAQLSQVQSQQARPVSVSVGANGTQNWVNSASKILGGAGNFINQNFIKPVVTSAKGAGEGLGYAFEDATGITSQRDKQFQQSQNEFNKMAQTQISRSRDPNISPIQQTQARNSAQSIIRAGDQENSNYREALNRKIEATDPIKQAGNVVNLASIVPFGSGVKTAATVTKPIVRKIAENTVKEGILGGVFGAGATASEKGKNATAEDYAKNIALGAGFGGAIGGATTGIAGAVANRRAQQAAKEAVADSGKVIKAATKELDARSNVAENLVKKPEVTAKATERMLSKLPDNLVAPVEVSQAPPTVPQPRQAERPVVKGKTRQISTQPYIATSTVDPVVQQRAAQQVIEATQKSQRPTVSLKNKQAASIRQGTNDLQLDETLQPDRVPLEVTNSGTINGEFQRAITDKDAAVINYLKNVEKETGQKGLVDQFYYDSGLQRRSNSIANAEVANSPDIQKALGGLKGQAKKDFDQYAAARNELTYADRGLQTSRPVEELQATVQALAPEHEARFVALNKFYKNYAKKQYDSGLIDEAKLNEYLANDDYSRIQRDMSDLASPRGKGGNSYSFGSPSAKQKRVGSQRDIQPSDITAINYAQNIQSEIQRNQTASNLIDVLQEQGHAKRVTDTTRKNTISRVVDGKTEIYEIPRDIKEVVDNVTPYQLGVLSRIISAPQRLLRAGATGLSVPFTAANYIKDQVGSAIFSKDFRATHTPANVFDGIFQAAKDYGVGNNSDLWQKFIAHSGDATSVDFIRNIKGGRDISREIRLGQAGRGINKVKNPIRSLEDLNQITERATRFQNFKGIYNKVLKETGNEAEATRQATLAAWQNSTDFSRAGNVSQVLNLLIPYFNASVQGTRLLGRKVVQNPVGTTTKILGFVGLPLAAATFYNMQDAKSKAIYDNISDYEKENNIIMVLPGAKQEADGSYSGVVKVPLQQGVSNLVQPMRHAVESYFDSNQADFPKMAQEFLGAVSGPVNISSPQQALGGLIPQAVKPLVQQAANRDFYSNKDIVPEYIEKSTDANGNPVKESDKAFGYTSGSARMIGDALGISPIRVEKFIKDTSGKVGQYTENAVDTALNAVGAIPQDQIGGVNAGEDIYRRFVAASGKENFMKSEGAKYFDRVKEATSTLNTNEKSAFEALHPAKKNFLGDVITDTDSIYDPAARLDTYNRYPKVFEADKKLDAQNRANGKPGNPLFDLDPTQVKKVLEKDNLPPGAKDPELSNLYQQEWYQDYQTKRSGFFEGIKAQQEQELQKAIDTGDTKKAEALQKAKESFDSPKNPYPTTPPELQQAMDTYSALPKGTGARKAWIQANPEAYQAMQNQYAAVDTWQNNKRLARGLDTTEGDLGKEKGYTAYSQSSSSSRGSGSKGGGKQSDRKYAVSINSGGEIAKPTVKAKGTPKGVAKRKITPRGNIVKAKVTSKKSLV